MGFDFRGDCKPQKLKTVKINAHVFQSETQKFGDAKIFQLGCLKSISTICHSDGRLHGRSMLAVKTKIYGVLYKQFSSIAFDETSSYWSALKSS